MWQKMLQIGSGGGSEAQLDLLNPIAFGYKAIAKSSSVTVSVPQKPKYIQLAFTTSATSGFPIYLFTYDVEKDKYWYKRANTTTDFDVETGTGTTGLISDITETSVKLHNISANVINYRIYAMY